MSSDLYKFTIRNGQIVAVYEYDDGIFKAERVDANESWALDAEGNVVKTEVERGRTETKVFSDPNGDGIYTEMSERYTATGSNTSTVNYRQDDLYEFSVSNGQITAVYEYEDGRRELESMDANETWTLQTDGIVVKTEVERYGQEISVYSDQDGDGLYNKIAETYSYDSSAAPGTYALARDDQYQFTVSNGRVTAVHELENGVLRQQTISPNTSFQIEANGDITRVENAPGYQETTVFRDSNGDGYFTKVSEIESGSYAPVEWRGRAGDDAYTGSGLDDIAYAGAGDDYIYTGSGNDRVFAQAGDDTIVGGHGGGDDYYSGGTGNDAVTYGSASAGIRVDLRSGEAHSRQLDNAGIGRDQLSGIENIVAGEYNDILLGSRDANSFYGAAGNDRLAGRAGDDDLHGGLGRDRLLGGSGNDALYGDSGDDKLFGNGGDDTLDGGDGNDHLNGGLGADRLYGGAGADSINAGADASRDIIVYKALNESTVAVSGRDTLSNFQSGVDRIDLSAIDANLSRNGDQAFLFSATGPAANALWTETGDDGLLLLSGDVSGDLIADFQIALVGVNTLSAFDVIA